MNKKDKIVKKKKSVKTHETDSSKVVAEVNTQKDKINYFALFFLSVFVVLILYGIYLLITQSTFKIHTTNMPNNAPSCIEGETRTCSVNECGGIQTCKNGVFSSCMWKQACTPNEVVPCVVNGCAVAYKTCNICGTSFSSCKLY